MSSIQIPKKPKYLKTGDNSAKIEIHDCHPGYGTTLGNSIRRVLFSSLEGAAIVSVKIKGVSHEFTSVPGVLEDVVHIILNLKKVRLKMYGDEPVKVHVSFKGAGSVTAKDIKCPSGIEVINKDQVIATVTDKKGGIEMEMEINRGMGYVPVEQVKRDNKEVGAILIDAIYTPIKRVNYVVEDMRVGKRTDYNKITLEIETDGSISPQEAFEKSVSILVEQFSAISEMATEESAAEKLETVIDEKPVKEEKEERIEEDSTKIKMVDIKGLSSRTLKVLEENEIVKVKDVIKMTEADLESLSGLGEKGIKEIKKSIGEFGLTLKQE